MAKVSKFSLVSLFSLIFFAASAMAVMFTPSLCSGSWKNCTSSFINDGRNSYITVLSTSNKNTFQEIEDMIAN